MRTTARASFALVAILLAPVASACDLGGPVRETFFTVIDLGRHEASRVDVQVPSVGGFCELANPITINGTSVAWVEPNEDGSGSSWIYSARLARPDQRSVLGVNGSVDAVTMFNDSLLYHRPFASTFEGISGRTRLSLAIPAQDITRVILRGDRAVATASGADGSGPRVLVLDLATGALLLNDTYHALGVSDSYPLTAFDGRNVMLGMTMVDVATGATIDMTPPADLAFLALDRGTVYARDAQGTLYRSEGGPRSWAPLGLSSSGATTVIDGTLIVSTIDVVQPAPPISWLAPRGSWAPPDAWARDALAATGFEPRYQLGPGLGAAGAVYADAADAKRVHVNLDESVGPGAATILDLAVRARASGSTWLVAPADLAPGLEVQDGDALTLLAAPGALPEVSHVARALGLADATFAPVDDAAPVALLQGADARFLLDCPTCLHLAARGPHSSSSFDAADAWTLPNGSLVAFRTTPWLDAQASPGVLSEENATNHLTSYLARTGWDFRDETLDRVEIELRSDGTPILTNVWTVRATPSDRQPWSWATVRQDATTGGPRGAPTDLKLDPADLAPTPSTTTPAPSAPPTTHPAPGAGALVTLMVGAGVAAAWTGRASSRGFGRRRT